MAGDFPVCVVGCRVYYHRPTGMGIHEQFQLRN